ncbi:MAG: D-alanine--D-alanine ligase family protein [Clostridiales bacterium]|jgi:D-alanine-D-alanine ligase|nr:D-alanine--D-alanine ligase [Eubacteriales bacterium]MDH7566465.1 D-alanine--D-alanine ligase family protein [Clostridiales bacterium]
MSRKKRVAVIFGGQSSEHEVSRRSAESVIKNINRQQYDVLMFGITKDGRWLYYDGPVEKISTGEWQEIAEARIRLLKASPDNSGASLSKSLPAAAGTYAKDIFTSAGAGGEDHTIDVVFPVMHGCNAEDGTIQGFFELAGIPYVGPGVLGSALGMDKAFSKIIFEKEGLPQGRYLVFTRRQISSHMDSVIREVERSLTYPCFVKPSNAGSSVGVSKAHDREELVKAVRLAARYDRKVLAEEFIDGREVECAVLGNDDPIASTVGEIIPCNEFYDYEAKYIHEDSKIVIPADLPEETIEEIRGYAVRAFRALDCSGLSRVDFFVHRDTGKVYLNEINTMPGFTSISMYPKLWEASGIPYGELIGRLLDLAVERFEENRRDYER